VTQKMRVLVTGSASHLGEALVRTLKSLKQEVVGLDILESRFTTHVGSITDRSWVRRWMSGVQAVFHAATEIIKCLKVNGFVSALAICVICG
jgi:UDP-glucose 4-epimerase